MPRFALAGDGAGITNLTGYLTVTDYEAASTNLLRFLTTARAPTGSTARGSPGEVRSDATNVYIYTRSNRWLRIPGTYDWP